MLRCETISFIWAINQFSIIPISTALTISMEKYHRNPAQFHEICNEQEIGQSSSENTTVNDSDEPDEVIFCRDHTKRLDRVCMTCKSMMCVLCDETSGHLPEHCVMSLPNKGCIKDLQHHLQRELTSVQQKLDLLKETSEKKCQSESDAYKEFRQLEGIVVRKIQEIFLRKERDFLEILRSKKAALTTQCDVLKATVNEISSLILRIQSGRCSLSDILQTFSSLKSLSSLNALEGVENRVDDHEDLDFHELSEQKLREAVVECQGSMENTVFSRKRKLEVSWKPIGKKDKNVVTEIKGRCPSTHIMPERENTQLFQTINKDLKTAADLGVIMVSDGDDPNPRRSTQAEGNTCSSTTCGRSKTDEVKSSEVSGLNLALDKDVNLVVIDDETQLSTQYPLMFNDIADKEFSTITPTSLQSSQQSRDRQNTENNVFETNTPQVDSTFFSRSLVFNDEDNLVPRAFAGGDQGVDEDSDLNSRDFPSDHDDDTTSAGVTLSWAAEADDKKKFKSPPLMYRNSPKSLVKSVEEDSLVANQVFLGECSCSTSNDASAGNTRRNDPQNDAAPHLDLKPASYETKLIRTIGCKGKNSGEFNEPEGLAVGPSGNIYVADSLNNRIQVFNSDLEFVISFGKTRPGFLKKPFDVTVYRSDATRDVSEVNRDTVVVADTYNNKLQFFWGDGKFSKKVGRKGGKHPQQFDGPYCVSVNSKGHIVVTDSGNHRIHVIKPNSQEDHVVFGSKGDGFMEFSRPFGVATDGNDNIIVADYDNNRIKMLSSTGETTKTFGEGNALGLSRPTHVAVSPRGNIFVSDSGNHRVQIYNKDGNYEESFGSMGIEPGRFQEPGGITWLPNGHVVVTDVTNCRLQIFDCPY